VLKRLLARRRWVSTQKKGYVQHELFINGRRAGYVQEYAATDCDAYSDRGFRLNRDSHAQSALLNLESAKRRVEGHYWKLQKS
jgi:hypothetical protein